MSEQFHIETPENITFRYDLAGLGSRFLATLIDSLIQGVLYTVLFLTAAIFFSRTARANYSQDVSNAIASIIFLVVFLIQFGYFILFEIALGGQTPGKRLIGLRVIKENGYPLGILDSIIRNIVRIIDFFPIAYGVGVIVMFLNARSKRLGDFAAGTIVVQVRQQVKLSDLQKSTVPNATPVEPREMPGIENLRPADVDMIESFFLRRADLRNAEEMALMIARAIQARLNVPEPVALTDSLIADQFLRDVLAAHRQSKNKTPI